jgi:Adenylate and Guanylate cyclase catalytic domain
VDFVAVVDEAIALLRQRGRMTYRTLQRQFELDDTALDDLTVELIKGQRLATDEDGEVLVWIGDAASPPAPAAAPTPAPLGYTPPYLAEKILTSRSALEGERKQVTVLFADLKGSTELIRDFDPEQARAILDPALHAMMEAVHRFEGTVNQVLGDGIMALFGAPLAHEDHALRACYAALAMQDALRRYADEVRRTHGRRPDHGPGGAHGATRHPREHSADRRDATARGRPGPGHPPGTRAGQGGRRTHRRL